MKEEMKSEFASKMEAIAKEATALIEKDSKRSVIIIATETDEDGTGAVIALAGCGGELAKGIAEFATNENSESVLVAGLKLAQTKMMLNTLKKLIGDGDSTQSDK